VDDPLIARRRVRELDARLTDVLLEFGHHFLGRVLLVGTGLVGRRHDVVDRRVGQLRKGDLEVALAEHPERLRARDLVDEVEPDEQLILSSRQASYLVSIPDLVVQCTLCSFLYYRIAIGLSSVFGPALEDAVRVVGPLRRRVVDVAHRSGRVGLVRPVSLGRLRRTAVGGDDRAAAEQPASRLPVWGFVWLISPIVSVVVSFRSWLLEFQC